MKPWLYVVKEHRSCNTYFVAVYLPGEEQLHGLCASTLYLCLFPGGVWAFHSQNSWCPCQKIVLSWAVLVNLMLWRCSLAGSLGAFPPPPAILADHISLNDVTNEVSKLLEEGCVCVLYFTCGVRAKKPLRVSQTAPEQSFACSNNIQCTFPYYSLASPDRWYFCSLRVLKDVW